MKIAFLTSNHIPMDDRIFYHQAKEVSDSGNVAEIISSKSEFIGTKNKVVFNSFYGEKLSKNSKIERFVERLTKSNPKIIICSEPLTILAASRYKKLLKIKIKIVYDITEWYPSKKLLNNFNFLTIPFHFFKFLFFNLIMASKVDAFIFGEYYKSKPYLFLFPKKSFLFLGYYPDLLYIEKQQVRFLKDELCLSYSGKLSIEKGFGNFLNVIKSLNSKRPRLKIHIKVIGWYSNRKEQKKLEDIINRLPEHVSFSFFPIQEFEVFIKTISDTDIFMDLRSNDFENQHCLPIKIFYYAALQRPVIFSNLKAIRKEVDIDKIGFLVNPTDPSKISECILKYLDDKVMYQTHCSNARELAETKYNWSAIKNDLLKFLDKLNKE